MATVTSVKLTSCARQHMLGAKANDVEELDSCSKVEEEVFLKRVHELRDQSELEDYFNRYKMLQPSMPSIKKSLIHIHIDQYWEYVGPD